MNKNKIVTSLVILLLLFSSTGFSYSQMENHSLALAKKFIDGKDKSFYRPDGGVVFLHGGTLPSVITAPLRITDIQLEPGEIIKDIQAGDTIRWQISPALSGAGETQVSHVIVKPTDINLETTLDIFTDRRAYHLNLKSSSKKYIPIVSFAYRDQLQKEWSNYQTQVKQYKENTTIKDADLGNQNVENLDFNYIISGSANWKPTRVYNDGVKTYIVMPSSMNAKDAPILLALDSNGNNKIVNYRLKNNKFIVDNLFERAVLILGVGSIKQKITITKSTFQNAALSVLDN